MVHTFDVSGRFYLYDTGSGALHICDELTCEVIKKMQGLSYDLKGVEGSVIAEIESEIAALKKNGVLFLDEPAAPPKKSGDIKALCLHICHDCNLRCGYCFADDGAYGGKRGFMSEKTALAAVDFLIENSGTRKILEIDFFGGEPLMNLDVVKKTVYYAKERAKERGKRFLFTLTTNGLLLNGDTADFLNEEMENVVLSLDGRKEIHNGVRKTVKGGGSFDAVFDRIKEFARLRGDKSYYVRGTFTAKNLDFYNDVLFLADNGFYNISAEPVVLPEGHELYIDESAADTVNNGYEVLAEEFLKRKKAGRAFNFFHFNIDLAGGPCLSKRVSACGAGNEYFSVTPDGNIYPCHQFAGNNDFLAGNVFEGKIDAFIRERFASSSLFTREKCADCFAKFQCSGGCAANNYNFNGDIDKPYEITCKMMKKRTELAMHIYSECKEKNL